MTFSGNVEATFLFNQCLKQAAPLRGRKPRPRNAWCASIFACHTHNHHLDCFAPLAKKTAVHRACIGVGIDRGDTKVSVAFKGAYIKAWTGHRGRNGLKRAQLICLHVGDGRTLGFFVALGSQILNQCGHARNGLPDCGIVLRRHTLGEARGRMQAKPKPGRYDDGADHSGRGRASKVQSLLLSSETIAVAAKDCVARVTTGSSLRSKQGDVFSVYCSQADSSGTAATINRSG